MLSTLCNISDSFVNADTDPRNVLMLQQWNGRSKTCRQLRDEPLVHSDPDWKAAADASFNPRLVSWSKNNLLAVAYGKSIDIVGLSNLHSREQEDRRINHLDTINAHDTVLEVSWCNSKGNEHILAFIIKKGLIVTYDSNSCTVNSPVGLKGMSPLCFDWNPGQNMMLTVGYSGGKCLDLDSRTREGLGLYPVINDSSVKEQDVTSIK
jgi:hypothetical protein